MPHGSAKMLATLHATDPRRAIMRLDADDIIDIPTITGEKP
jgi:hypothetical protein